MSRTKTRVHAPAAPSATAPEIVAIPFTPRQVRELLSLIHPDRHITEFQARAAEMFAHVRKFSR